MELATLAEEGQKIHDELSKRAAEKQSIAVQEEPSVPMSDSSSSEDGYPPRRGTKRGIDG